MLLRAKERAALHLAHGINSLLLDMSLELEIEFIFVLLFCLFSCISRARRCENLISEALYAMIELGVILLRRWICNVSWKSRRIHLKTFLGQKFLALLHKRGFANLRGMPSRL
jgi:hypothetical protein